MKNTFNDRSETKLGRAGETIVMNYFSRNGSIVEASVNQFDSQKDMLVDGTKKVEVKTQVPFIKKDAFTFRENQLKKCLESDELYFVSVPNLKIKHYSAGKVYRADPKKMKYDFYRTKDGRQMVIIPIQQDAIIQLFVMSEHECELLRSYSVSKWN
jgi:hypothetical protein